MQRDAGDRLAPGDLREFRRSGHRWRRQTCGKSAGGTAFATETDENGVSAGGGDARGTRVSEAGNAANGHGRAGSFCRVEKIDILRAKIGDDELRTIGSQS